MRPPKVKLSQSLEEAFFASPPSKNEIANLRKLCEAYQKGYPSRTGNWDRLSKRAYHQYLGYLAALKARRSLEDLEANGYINASTRGFDEVIDFGAGTLGSLLGVFDFFKEKEMSCSRAIAIDRQVSPMQWGLENFRDFLPANLVLQAEGRFRKDSTKKRIIIASDVINELKIFSDRGEVLERSPGLRLLESWLRALGPEDLLVLISPASREWNQRALQLRDYFAKQEKVLLPCPNNQPCPALAQSEWCHEDRRYSAPQRYWALVDQLGFRRPSLQFSLLVLGHQRNRLGPQEARVVSNPLEAKGKSEKWLCHQGKRWKASCLLRDQSPEAQKFHLAERGDVIPVFDSIQQSTLKNQGG